jgi:formate dehydrogenase assembly factor FdhD
VLERDGERDTVAVEEPLEIRVDGEQVAVAMRTPGNDEELALGFLYGEGLIDGPTHVGLTDDLAANTIEVRGPLARELPARRFYTTSSCGVCGKGAIEEVMVHCRARARSAGRSRAARGTARPTGAARLRAHRGPARDGPVRRTRRAAVHARGRRAP